MSLALQGRGLFGFSLGGLGIPGCRTLGCPGSQGRVPNTFCLLSSSVTSADSPSELLPHFRQGVSSFCFCERHRTGVLGTRFLQLFICYSEGRGRLAASHRPFSSQPLCLPFSLLHGNLPVGPPFPAPRGLDDFSQPSGCIPPGSSPPRISVVPQVLSWPSDLPFWFLCFDLSSAPQVFTHVMAPISSIMHRFGYRVLGYLDDWLETSCYGFAES